MSKNNGHDPGNKKINEEKQILELKKGIDSIIEEAETSSEGKFGLYKSKKGLLKYERVVVSRYRDEMTEIIYEKELTKFNQLTRLSGYREIAVFRKMHPANDYFVGMDILGLEQKRFIKNNKTNLSLLEAELTRALAYLEKAEKLVFPYGSPRRQ